jgi:hypothetical protein
VSYLEATGDRRGTRFVRISSDDADVARDRRLVLLLHGDQLNKNGATAQKTQIQSPVEGEPAPKELVGGYCARTSP